MTTRRSRAVRSDGPVHEEPGKRRPAALDGDVLGAEGGEATRAPVLEVILGIAEVPPVSTAEGVSESEERLMGDAQEKPVSGDAPDLAERAPRIGEVFQYLEAQNEVVSLGGKGQRVHIPPKEARSRAS